MAGDQRAVSVGTTATRLDTVTETDRASGSSFVFYNNGSATIFMGSTTGVTTANGFPVAAGSSSPGIDLGPDEAVYGIVASGTVEARVLEVGI